MTIPASQKPEVKARREFYTEQIKDSKNHAALVLELTYLHDQVNLLKGLNEQRLSPTEVVVNVKDGDVQGAASTRPIKLMVLDSDLDGEEDENLLVVDAERCHLIERRKAKDADWLKQLNQVLAPPGASQAPVAETLTLYAVSGRLHGDDDDTVHMVWSTDRKTANAEFERLILEENNLQEPSTDRPIYQTSLNSVCTAVRSNNGISSSIKLNHGQSRGLKAAFDAYYPPSEPAAQDTTPDVPK